MVATQRRWSVPHAGVVCASAAQQRRASCLPSLLLMTAKQWIRRHGSTPCQQRYFLFQNRAVHRTGAAGAHSSSPPPIPTAQLIPHSAGATLSAPRSSRQADRDVAAALALRMEYRNCRPHRSISRCGPNGQVHFSQISPATAMRNWTDAQRLDLLPTSSSSGTV